MKMILQLMVMLFVITGCAQKTYIEQKYEPPLSAASLEKEIVKSIEKIPPKRVPQIEEKEEKIKNKIAIIFPSKTIGKYALEATSTINTYLIHKNESFLLKTYDLVVQNKQTISDAIQEIQKDNITKVIAMITKENLHSLKMLEGIENMTIYLPLIHKDDIANLTSFDHLNLIFGAISYKEQFKKLIAFQKGKPLVEFYDNSGIGQTLHEYLKDEKMQYVRQIDDNNGRYKSFLEHNRRLRGSVVLLNTPIVKSSILLSAIHSEQVNIDTIASTQLNYTPLLFSLTQRQDRRKLVVANSIGNIPNILEEYNSIIGNNLTYSWVNYSTIVGVEYLVSRNIDLFSDLIIENKQVIFPVKLYRVGSYSFKLIQ